MKTRETSVLLGILLSHVITFGISKSCGLCSSALNLLSTAKINNEEHTRLLSFIKDNRPFFSWRHGFYYWKPGKAMPRIRWIRRKAKQERGKEYRAKTS